VNSAADVSGMPYLPRMEGTSPSRGTVRRVNRRAVSGRGVLTWVCWGIATLLAAGCALGLTASAAVAGQVPVILQYSCSLPLVGAQPLTATFVWPSELRSATVNTRTPTLPVEASATVSSAARTVVSFAGIERIKGTADVSAEVMAPQGDIGENVQLTVPLTNVSTGSGPLTVPASGLIPPVLLSQTGQAKVVVEAMNIHLATLTASGTLSVLGNISISCTLDSGQTGVVASLRILPAVSPAARSASAAQSAAPRPAPTRTQASTRTQTRTPAHAQIPAPSSSPGPPRASLSLLGHSVSLARSYPGFLLLAVFLLCAAILLILKTALRIFNVGLAAVVRGPAAKRSPP
jgi:hypothetical protein